MSRLPLRPDPDKKAGNNPPPKVTLSAERAARLLEVALTTPDGQSASWHSALWKPPTVEMLRAWVPEYEVEQRVARGSSGWVYVARHRLLDRRVALKVLAPAEMGAEEETSKLRALEGRLVARLSHPNVLRVYDSRPLPDGQHLFAFQYAEGGSLRQRLGAGLMPRTEVLALAAGLAAGLAHAHAGGIIHRDLKPENILFNEAGTPMIGDFGSALKHGPENAAALACGTTGTPHYRAPEQVAGGPLGPAVDLYAFGIILHEMLTGTVPEGTGSAQVPTMDPAVPSDLRPLLSGLLQPDPERRSPAATGLAQQLRRQGHFRFRRRWVLTSASAAGLTLAGGLGWWIKRPPPPLVGTPVPVPSKAAARAAALMCLKELRRTEARGEWEAGHALYAPTVDYFSYGTLPHDAVAGQRRAFASGHSSFQALLLEDYDFPVSTAPQVRVEGLYWAVTPKRGGGASLGTFKDELIFQPSAGGGALWQIVSHQHGEPPNLWSCEAGRSISNAAATAWVDAFLAMEASGDVDAQLKSYAPRVRYYGLGWVAHRHIRESLGDRQRQRPNFRCERRGPVKVLEGSHLRWRLEVPCQSYPVLTVVPGSEKVRVRTFLIAPRGGAEWVIIGEATPLSGQAGLDSFWQDGAGP